MNEKISGMHMFIPDDPKRAPVFHEFNKSMDRNKMRELEYLAERVDRGLADVPWHQYVKLVRKFHELVYKMKYDTGITFATVTEMLAKYPHIVDVFQRMAAMRGVHAEDTNELLRALVVHNYIQAGAKDFYLYSDLVPMLRDTDVPDIPSTQIRFPFEAFTFAFRLGTIRQGSWINFDRIVLSCSDGRHVHGFLIGDNYDGAPPILAILDDKVSLKQLESNGKPLHGTAPEDVQKDIFRLIINTLLYINCENADLARDTSKQDTLREKLAAIKNPKKKKTRKQKQLEQDIAKAKHTYIYIVGKNIRADDAYRAVPANEEGRKILKRFRVRGHWRNQPYGPERSLVKRRWISPYWKGPDMAELINNGYVLKQREEQTN